MGEKWHLGAFSGPSSFFLLKQLIKLCLLPLPPCCLHSYMMVKYEFRYRGRSVAHCHALYRVPWVYSRELRGQRMPSSHFQEMCAYVC